MCIIQGSLSCPNTDTEDYMCARMTSSLITMHIALSLEALGFGAILCYLLFIILGIYLISCISHRGLYNTQEMPLPL